MQDCEIPRENMLPNPVLRLSIEDENCDFECAKQAAIDKAMDYDNSPQLLSWFDRKNQNYTTFDECCLEGEPSWVAYGFAQGGNLTVDVNNEEYVFIFKKGHGLP